MLNEIAGLANRRDDFVHGAAIEHIEHASSLVVTIGTLLQPSGHPRRLPVKVSTKDVTQAGELVTALASRLLDLAATLGNTKE